MRGKLARPRGIDHPPGSPETLGSAPSRVTQYVSQSGAVADCYRHGGAELGVFLNFDGHAAAPGHHYLTGLHTRRRSRRRGHARRVMAACCRDADREGAVLHLIAEPTNIAHGAEHVGWLTAFYRSLGFEDVDNRGTMRRWPQPGERP